MPVEVVKKEEAADEVGRRGGRADEEKQGRGAPAGRRSRSRRSIVRLLVIQK